jgi:hypothetical protein
MKHAMYCENGCWLAFVDPETGQRSGMVDDYDDDVLMRGLFDSRRKLYPLPNFCPDCGAKTLSKCQKCSSFILYNTDLVHYRQNYCTVCGEAFPWVTTSLQELGRVTDEAADLTADEKTALKQAYPELTRDTPKTRGAVETLKFYYAKFSPAAWSILRTVLTNVGTDGAKQGLSDLFSHIK